MSAEELLNNNIWVLNTVLQKLGLEKDEDMRQEGLICIWLCARKYKPESGVKFSTYAYKSAYFHILKLKQKEIERQKQIVSADKIFSLADKEKTPAEIYQIKAIVNSLSGKTKQCAIYLSQGYSKAEIKSRLNLSTKSLNTIINSIRRKIPPL